MLALAGSKPRGFERLRDRLPWRLGAAQTAKPEEDDEEDMEDEMVNGYYAGFSMEDARQQAEADHEAVKKKKPREVLEELQRGNTRFWMDKTNRPAERGAFERRALVSKQYPTAAILGCADSRVPVEYVFDQGLGDLFTVRVAGNCLDTSTEASLLYAVRNLGVKVLIVMGHEGCGAIKAAQLPIDAIDKEPTLLSKLLKSLREGLDIDALSQVCDARALDREAVTTNVKHQVEMLITNRSIMDKVKSRELIVVGAFYEISSGIVDFFHEVSTAKGPVEPQPQTAAKSQRRSLRYF